jgi:flagellar protein FliL
MATAAKAEDHSNSAPSPASGALTTKKLVLILVIALSVLAVGIGATVVIVMKRAAQHAAAADDDEDATAARKKLARQSKPPIFVPLDPFVVNLTDREQDRYAQVGVTLEIDDPAIGEKLKTFMPAIRNGILMTLAHKGSRELLDRKGKEKLAEEIMREAARPLALDEDAESPVRAVHFSSFIIQ